jgi:lysophospholipase L1-like esterase
MIKNALFLLCCVASINLQAQQRYQSEIFSSIDSVTNIEYGQALNIKGNNEKLLLDMYMPTAQTDTIKKRPVLLFIHGGGFQNNSKTGGFSNMLCLSFAKRGYVTVSIDYRLGIENNKSKADYAAALYRAQQDGKAAIRYLRKNAALYNLDTAQIFITGSSAGSKTCLAIAYMDETEVPATIDQAKWGSLEGSSGNEGYSSKVSGVINNWGAIIDYNWIKQGDAPLFNVAGTEDKTVPYDSSYEYHGFKYGPYILFQYCLQVGVSSGWRPFYATGHTLDNKKIKQDSAIHSISDWLYTQLKINKPKNEEGVLRYKNDINKFDSLNRAEVYSKDAVLFLGSSYIRMWKNIRQDIGYNDIIHRGFGGSNLRDVAYYVKRIVYPHQPKAIFMYVGNDIVDNPKDKSPDQVLEYFKYVVKVIREKYPTVPIAWLQISPSEKRWGAWDKVKAANSLIKSYCETQQQLYFVSFENGFLDQDKQPIKSLFLSDKLHYNEEGYKVWGAAIKDQFFKIINP